MAYDSIVIGAGLSGLTSALLLARSGRKVLILERHHQPAPVVRGFSRDGLYFDSGFHYVGGLGAAGPLGSFLGHLGLAARLEIFPYAERGFDRLRIAATGETFALPVGFAAIKAELGERFPAARAKLESYLDLIAQQWCSFPYLDLDADISAFGMQTVHGPSLYERLQEFSTWPQLQGLLSMHSLLYGVPPEDAPETLNAQVAGSYYHSVHGIVGGGRALVEALLELLTNAGVEVRCRAEVTAVRTDAGAVSGVQLLSGEKIPARELVVTLNPALLPKMLPPGVLRPAYLKRLNNLRQTSSAYIVFARSAKPLEFLRHRNLFIQQQAGIFGHDAQKPLTERSIYLTAADQGRDGALMGLIGIVPASYAEVAAWDSKDQRHARDYQAHKTAIGETLLRMFAANCPELADLELLELATPLTLRDYSNAPAGAIYGVGRFIGQYNPSPVTRLPGLFLSGQAIAAPGLLGALVASYLTCGSILGHEHLRKELKIWR
ncbi:phytoene desaturase family protein [Geopsychrobacter electrodiphilus]|uniref:phytoene desaturase family protein n=1 Tax=Geopsychrobacter electrodiphilus TaxID=225196 RepID=UPI0003764B52|nr:FAD-dependent oxidoreductase [Geopsychrobacter electrodiphilus]